MQSIVYQRKRLKAKRQLFPGCKFSMFCFKVFNKKSGMAKQKPENPVSSVQISKSLKYQICKILKKLRIKGTKNKDTGAGKMNAAGSEVSSYMNINENRRGGSAHVLPYRAEPNPAGNNGQGAPENYVTEKMVVGLMIMSHYFVMLNNYVGSNKPNFLLIFIISMAMAYFTITFVRSVEQVEDFISGLVSRACSCFMLL